MEIIKQLRSLQGNKKQLNTEIRAGVTTFLTMAYILFVNTNILSQAIKFPGAEEQIFTTTALAGFFGSVIMGVLAGYPFGLAPGMGVNAYFTYSVVLGMGISWQSALGATFISGILFIIISVTGLRTLIVESIPLNIQRATTAGIGVFLAIVGLESSQIIVDHPATLVTLGDMSNPNVLLCLFGIAVTAILFKFNIRGSILLGIFSTTLMAILFSAPVYNGSSFSGFPNGIFSLPKFHETLLVLSTLWGP